MKRTEVGRAAMVGLAASVLLAVAVGIVGHVAEATDASPVPGRYSVLSEAGGAVWAFQPGGELIVVGPGDLVSRGTWTEGPASGELDASLAIEITGQELLILGMVSPDGMRIALYVTATQATAPQEWTAWPAESRLLGHRIELDPEGAPSPTPSPVECLRPAWVNDEIDWDRCDGVAGPAAEQSPAAPRG